MNKILLIFFTLFLNHQAFSQHAFITNYLSKDSLPYKFDGYWKYNQTDDSLMMLRNYYDFEWSQVKLDRFFDTESDSFNFKGQAWFRFHFDVDSTLIGIPLTLYVDHSGASQVFLDGKLIAEYGTIKDKENSEYYDPKDIPKIIVLNDTNSHVLAIHYANYNNEDDIGFRFKLSGNTNQFEQKEINGVAITFLLISLGFIFLTLSILHLFFYLYYRHIPSNLYFSIFTFCIASLFILSFIATFTHTPALIDQLALLSIIISSLACVSFTFFIHILLAKKSNFPLWFVSISAFLSVLLCQLNEDVSSKLFASLIGLVALYASYSIIVAIIKKVKGVWIIGIGLLFFTFSILGIVLLSIFSGNLELNTGSNIGIFLLVLILLDVLSIPLSMSIYQAWLFSNLNKDLSNKLIEVERLSEITLQQELEKKQILENQKHELELRVDERTAQLKSEKKKSDDLLLNILPIEVAEELKEKGMAEAKQYNHVTVLFTDFVNFTGISELLSPKELVKEIHENFTAFDAIIEKHGLEKIKTIGDAYLAVCGLPIENEMHAVQVLNAAKDIQTYMSNKNGKFQIRIGVNSGPVIAGIVGVKKYAYDIWGDCVNTAARMEQNSEAGKINISGATYDLVKANFNCVHRGKIAAKNKGEIDMYFVN